VNHTNNLPANRSMPASVVIPVIAYANVREAVEWLCRSFGFVERLRIDEHRSQLSYGDGAIIVSEGSMCSPTDTMPKVSVSHSVMVRVADVDAHYQQARSAGAAIVGQPTDYPYGERQYTAEDPGGHLWTFSQTIADVDPEDWTGTLEGV
jgi:uncharacterized glyoxalase superfamily protein PhnB